MIKHLLVQYSPTVHGVNFFNTTRSRHSYQEQWLFLVLSVCIRQLFGDKSVLLGCVPVAALIFKHYSTRHIYKQCYFKGTQAIVYTHS